MKLSRARIKARDVVFQMMEEPTVRRERLYVKVKLRVTKSMEASSRPRDPHMKKEDDRIVQLGRDLRRSPVQDPA